MKIPVHMVAYETKADIREVTIPDEEVKAIWDSNAQGNFNTTMSELLNLVFKYGQNDFQPMNHPSVSVGDVIEYDGKYFIVLGVGFNEITERQFRGMPDQVAMKMNWVKKLHFGVPVH